jgi:hypothetical protein
MIAVTGDELGGGGVAAILLALLILVVAIVWMLFPILLLIKFNDLVQIQRAIHRALLRRTPGGMK